MNMLRVEIVRLGSVIAGRRQGRLDVAATEKESRAVESSADSRVDVLVNDIGIGVRLKRSTVAAEDVYGGGRAVSVVVAVAGQGVVVDCPASDVPVPGRDDGECLFRVSGHDLIDILGPVIFELLRATGRQIILWCKHTQSVTALICQAQLPPRLPIFGASAPHGIAHWLQRSWLESFGLQCRATARLHSHTKHKTYKVDIAEVGI